MDRPPLVRAMQKAEGLTEIQFQISNENRVPIRVLKMQILDRRVITRQDCRELIAAGSICSATVAMTGNSKRDATVKIVYQIGEPLKSFNFVLAGGSD